METSAYGTFSNDMMSTNGTSHQAFLDIRDRYIKLTDFLTLTSSTRDNGTFDKNYQGTKLTHWLGNQRYEPLHVYWLLEMTSPFWPRLWYSWVFGGSYWPWILLTYLYRSETVPWYGWPVRVAVRLDFRKAYPTECSSCLQSMSILGWVDIIIVQKPPSISAENLRTSYQQAYEEGNLQGMTQQSLAQAAVAKVSRAFFIEDFFMLFADFDRPPSSSNLEEPVTRHLSKT